MSQSNNASKKIIGDKACPSCTAKGRDSKGNHLILFENDEGRKWGKCNRCGHYEPPEGNLDFTPRKEKSPEELKAELEEVESYPFRNLTSRRIPVSVATRFGVRAGLSEADGETVVEHYYPRHRDGEIVAYNTRILDPKAFFYRGSPAGGTEPFGLQQAKRPEVGRRYLFILEDELSAMSAFSILEQYTPDEYKNLKPAVVSWSAGVKTAPQDISYMKETGFLEMFREIIYIYDNDKEGELSVEVVRGLLPECKFVTMPLKDVNDMHMARREKEAYSLMKFQSKVRTPDCAVTVRDIYEESLKPPAWGKSYPWEGLTNLTYGQHDGELISIGGGTGIGKTLLAHEIAAWNIMEHKENVGVFLLEEAATMSLRNIAGKIASVPFHKPDIPFNEELYRESVNKLLDSLFLWKNKGMNDWPRIKECLRFWVLVNGCKSLFVDNMTSLVNHLAPAEQNTEIARIATDCAGMADELGCRIFMFSHLNPPGGSKSHEEGAEVKENQFTGSRALQRWSQLMLGFERNKQADGDSKHNSLIRVLKDRKYGNTGTVPTRYDVATGRLVSRDNDAPLTGDDDDDKPF